MKQTFLFIVILFFVNSVNSQNLIPNPDFEYFTSCPDDISQIDTVAPWFSPNYATPDYYNSCTNTSQIDVPTNTFGYQYPHSGSGYAGIVAFVDNQNNYREFIGVQLSSALQSNNCYQLQFYLNLANKSKYNTTDISAYFTDTAIIYPNVNQLPVSPQLNNSGGILADSLGWTAYSWNYIATGGENYLIIGNFKDDLSIDTMVANPGGIAPFVYFYIDDVSLTPCTSLNENISGIFELFPNPTGDLLEINTGISRANRKLKVYNILGVQVYETDFADASVRINVQFLSAGLYYAVIESENHLSRKQFLKK